MSTFLTPLRMGNPLLTQVSQAVEDPNDPEIQSLIDDMIYTILSIQERVGIAAPQIGFLKRIIVYRVPVKPVNKRYVSISDGPQLDIPWSVLINPVITPLSQHKENGWEGCISVPGLLGEVARYTEIHYQGTNARGEPISRTATGFHARLIQHECDHLDGILFPMRLTSPDKIGFEEEILKQIAV